ncbi:unnamed protein product, partial [Enterobius vermicularis]|uniref:LysM domain-containing protein n=1 Tax=Enterobius vermicularis TaxID=51028 RepID=A0A0N4VBD9_ENTVE
KVKPGDSLNKIALQFSVPVSEIKRANGIVGDQEIFALPSVKIPISRLRKELDLEHERELLKNDSPVTESDLFKKADESVSQVRDNLPNQSGLEGAFHFVDAGSPDSAHKVIVLVLTLFILIPLLLTYFEEHQELVNATTGH